MAGTPEDKEIKALQLEFRNLEKSAHPRISILQDLALTCDMCKTPEVRLPLSQMLKQYHKDLLSLENDIQSNLNRQLNGKMLDIKKIQEAAEKEIKRSSSKQPKGPITIKPKLKFKLKGKIDDKGKAKIKSVEFVLGISGKF